MKVEFEEGKSVILRVKRSGGIYQRVVFRMVAQPFPEGKYKLLVADRSIDFNEMTRLSNELDLPIKAGAHLVFPKGKEAHDYRL